MTEIRSFYRYVLYKVDPGWLQLPDEERSLAKKELSAALSSIPEVGVNAYSMVGLRADADIMLWEVARTAEDLQALQVRINGTALGRWLRTAHSFLAMTRPSQYLKGHRHDGQEVDRAPGPVGATYLFVYPMDKKREWYRLPFEDRRAMMAEHLTIGHRYPNVKIHTGYSFGIDDQEFVVAFEGESVGEFLELVEELRSSRASAYTARDVPVFTAVRMPIEDILDQLDGG